MAETAISPRRGQVRINLWPKRKVYISLRIKLLTAFTVLFTLIFGGVSYWFLTYATNKAMENIQGDLLATLNGSLAGIDGDNFDILATKGSDSDPRYLNHISWLNTIHKLEPRAYPYTYIRGPQPDQVTFIGDVLMVLRPDDAAHFHETYTPHTPGILLGLDQPAQQFTPYSDKWGHWISAYRPILDTDGNKVGALGIDFTTQYVDEVRQGVLDTVLGEFVITYSLMLALVIVISRWLTRPLIRLTHVARQIGEGNYEQNFDDITTSLFPDEIVTLTYAYEDALSKVRGVVQNLTNQVTELQIVIDESQRKKNVSEIVETDFFRDLQAKAQRMRTQHVEAAAAASAENSKPEAATLGNQTPAEPAT